LKCRVSLEDGIHPPDEAQALVENGSIEKIKVHPVADVMWLVASQVTDCGVEEGQCVDTTSETNEFRKTFPASTFVENFRSAKNRPRDTILHTVSISTWRSKSERCKMFNGCSIEVGSDVGFSHI
jgi:hypothetical protein